MRQRKNCSGRVVLCQGGLFLVCEQKNEVARHHVFKSSGRVQVHTQMFLAHGWRNAAWEVLQQQYLRVN